VTGDRLHRVWKNAADNRIFLSGISPSETWSGPVDLGFRTSHTPALAVPGNRLYLAWKSADGDRMQISISEDAGGSWLQAIDIPGLTSHGPALTVLGTTLYRVWKEVPTDEQMHFSSSPDGKQWSAGPELKELPIEPGLTSHGPALTAGPGGKLYRLWKRDFNEEIMMSVGTVRADGLVDWTPEDPVAGLTSDTPAIANV
jgi:hypothetical protein